MHLNLRRLPIQRLARFAAGLRDSTSGLALTEFAMSLPVLLTLGLAGLETANFAMAHLRVSNIAVLTADNAARVRDSIDEADIIEIFTGAKMTGEGIDFADNGRIILSSMMRNQTGQGQFFNWQRCDGAKQVESTYQTAPTNQQGAAFQGVGSGGNQIAAAEGMAVMVVEVVYDYQPIIPSSFLSSREVRYQSAFNVRQRTNQELTNSGNLGSAQRRTCDKYEA